jgi:hypothetical protein
MTETREAASAVAATPTTATAVTPNVFTFSGRRDDTQVAYSTTSITGQLPRRHPRRLGQW